MLSDKNLRATYRGGEVFCSLRPHEEKNQHVLSIHYLFQTEGDGRQEHTISWRQNAYKGCKPEFPIIHPQSCPCGSLHESLFWQRQKTTQAERWQQRAHDSAGSLHQDQLNQRRLNLWSWGQSSYGSHREIQWAASAWMGILDFQEYFKVCLFLWCACHSTTERIVCLLVA